MKTFSPLCSAHKTKTLPVTGLHAMPYTTTPQKVQPKQYCTVFFCLRLSGNLLLHLSFCLIKQVRCRRKKWF